MDQRKYRYYQVCIKHVHGLNCRFSGLKASRWIIAAFINYIQQNSIPYIKAMQYSTIQGNMIKKILEWITHTKSKFYISGRQCVHVRGFLYKTYFLNYLVYSE